MLLQMDRSRTNLIPSQKLEVRVDKIRDCRKKADAQKLDVVERIKFVRECLQ